jgi:hypothetical protein
MKLLPAHNDSCSRCRAIAILMEEMSPEGVVRFLTAVNDVPSSKKAVADTPEPTVARAAKKPAKRSKKKQRRLQANSAIKRLGLSEKTVAALTDGNYTTVGDILRDGKSGLKQVIHPSHLKELEAALKVHGKDKEFVH